MIAASHERLLTAKKVGESERGFRPPSPARWDLRAYVRYAGGERPMRTQYRLLI